MSPTSASLPPLPPIPATTIRAASAAFGRGNPYLTIGDQAGHLLAGANLADLGGSSETPAASIARLALTTIFQSLERLSDHQASEAIRLRTDWKYALHLPLDGPTFSPQVLCDFRQRLLFNTAGQQAFQHILDRMAEAGLLDVRGTRRMDVACVLTAVCMLSRLDQLVRAMRLALESIASNFPAWLRANALPHWYERYAHTPTVLRQPGAKGDWQAEWQADWDEMARAIGADARHLLETISTTHVAVLDTLPEIQALRQEWYQQCEQRDSEIRWRSPRCADCSRGARSFEGTREAAYSMASGSRSSCTAPLAAHEQERRG